MKIIVNSNPRTGTTYLIDMLRCSAEHHLDRLRNGEYSNTNDWIIKCHEPLLLLSDISGVSQITIVRDPLDTISSNMFRHTSGLNSNSIWGNTGVSNENKTNNYNDSRFLEGLKQSISKWKEYADNTVLNKDKLIVVSFDYMVNNTADLISSVFAKQGADASLIEKVSDNSIAMHMDIMKKSLSSNQNHINGSDNRLPVPKPDGYYELRSVVEKQIAKQGLNDLYLELIDKL